MASPILRNPVRRAAGLGRSPSAVERHGVGYNRVMAKTVAVIGASNNRHKYGNKALRAFAQQGYTVLPVNPHEPQSRGSAPIRSVLDIPGPIDMATVYVQPRRGLEVMEELSRKGVGEVWLNPGADDDDGRGAGQGARSQRHPGLQHHRRSATAPGDTERRAAGGGKAAV